MRVVSMINFNIDLIFINDEFNKRSNCLINVGIKLWEWDNLSKIINQWMK